MTMNAPRRESDIVQRVEFVGPCVRVSGNGLLDAVRRCFHLSRILNDSVGLPKPA